MNKLLLIIALTSVSASYGWTEIYKSSVNGEINYYRGKIAEKNILINDLVIKSKKMAAQ